MVIVFSSKGSCAYMFCFAKSGIGWGGGNKVMYSISQQTKAICLDNFHFHKQNVTFPAISPANYNDPVITLDLGQPSLWGFSPSIHAHLWHQLGVLWFNSIQHYLQREKIRFQRLKAQSHKAVPQPLTLQMTVKRSVHHLCFWSASYRWKVPQPPP